MSLVGSCPECGAALPVVRWPTSWRQILWGGWTCKRCGAEVDRWGRKVGQAGVPRQSWTRDDSSTTDRPARLTLSDARLRELRPDLYDPDQRFQEFVGLEFPFRTYLGEALRDGEACAAVVVTARPLRVAAYSSTLDRIAMLAFDDDLGLTDAHGLRPGSRLVTVNSYRREAEPDVDIFLPADHAGYWTGFAPLLADFLTDDAARLAELKASIPEPEWARAARLGTLYLNRFPGLARDGRPIHSFVPARPRAEAE